MSVSANGALDNEMSEAQKKRLFVACFVALIATAFGFILRVMLIPEWGKSFGWTEVQKGEIMGAGLWPFAISIILFSLIIDKIGYGKAMMFAFVAHLVSAIMTVTATGYTQLYWAMFISALANGTVEAVINPVVATVFSDQKVTWLNRLHAGWPGGLVIGGILAIALATQSWQMRFGIVFLPVIAYGVMMLGQRWPVNERVAAGVPYKEMLKEFGVLGALIVNFMMFSELGRVFGWTPVITYGLMIGLTVAFGALVNFAPGRPLFIVLLLIMVPLATTELGVDSWVTDLMTPAMSNIGLAGGWVLVYTSFIMMVLRFLAGPIVHSFSPLGLLAASSAIAMLGLLALAGANGAMMILLAATLYGVGKSFFWPTMLGVVAEQSPRGGALTLNAIAGVGMLGVGVVGAVLLGFIQDTSVENRLRTSNAAIHSQVVSDKTWVFGGYKAVDATKSAALSAEEQATIKETTDTAKKNALSTVAILPAIMLVSYLLLIAYFKSKGGYRPVDIGGPDEPVVDDRAPAHA
jgi:MFS family permease